MPTIAVDAMGGANAPEEVVRGVALVSMGTDIDCLLVGDETRIQTVLDTVAYNPDRIEVVHAPGVVGMGDEPRAAGARRDTSLAVGLQAVIDGRAQAMVSAGNTGAAIVACSKTFTLIPGIRRAALASVYPRQVEYPGQDPLALLVDVGATVRCEPDELVHFALMGAAYARRISKVASPRIGLLNMGTEEGKGGEMLQETHRRLRLLTGLHFIGNVEGHELVRGKADVIVCEGFAGNVVLKLLEGIGEVLSDVARSAGEQKLLWRVGLRLLSQGIDRVRALSDYTQYGGSPILGFQQLFIKCHGRSQAPAIANAVKVAAKAVRDRVPAEIADAVATVR